MKNNNLLQFILVIIGSILAFVLLRFPFPANLIALFIAVLLMVVFYYYNVIDKENKKKKFATTFVGQMDKKREDCQQKLKQLRKELKLIEGNIKDLKAKLIANPQATEEAVQESNKIINGFQEEKKLRHSKINFYDLALSKFNQIIKNHQLAEDLKLKREKLEAFKENNIEEVAEMEGMKTFIDYEKTYIETIDELSLKMLSSRSVEKAEALQLELVEMTKELREL